MSPKNVCEEHLRSHLEADERVLAVGRCEDMTEGGSIERGGVSGGAPHSFVMVTDLNLRWVPYSDLELRASLDLGSVTEATERSVAHRYAISLHHGPLTRPHRVPAHRFVTFEWGNAVADGVFSQTTLAFSKRDTEAALALRDQLHVRGLLDRM